MLALTPPALQVGADLLRTYSGLNVFDAVHVGQAITEGEPIVSKDTLYPTLDEIGHIDPRSL